MPKKNKAMPSVEELVSTIKRSSLPTVVIEGSDDVVVFRGLEEVYYDCGLSILPAGGRNNVLQLFSRRNEFLEKLVVFLVDKDEWVLNEIPAEYVNERLICTDGYSIENDIYVDGGLERLMSPDERVRFREELEVFLRWYALAINRALQPPGGEEYKCHPNVILDDALERERRMILDNGENFPEDLHARISEGYSKILRGKSLMALLTRQLSYKGRPVRHNHLQLMETISCQRGPLINRIYLEVASAVVA